MNAPADIHQLVSSLKEDGEPFAIATVIRTISVTSAKAGAKAVIQADGTIAEGWIGGGCARAAVLKAARDSIADGEPRLVSVQPEDLLSDSGNAVPGAQAQGAAGVVVPDLGGVDPVPVRAFACPEQEVDGGPRRSAIGGGPPRLGEAAAFGVGFESEEFDDLLGGDRGAGHERDGGR